MLMFDVFRFPVCNSTLTPSGLNHLLKFWKCCSARISVGAINATLKPLSSAINAVQAATAVLPDPTSPCNKRRIGWRAAHVRPDFAEHPGLRAGELETKPGQKRLHQVIVTAARQRLCLRLEFFPPQPDLHLQFDEFIQRQPPSRDFDVCQFLGEMRHVHRVGPGRKGSARRCESAALFRRPRARSTRRAR